MNNCHFVQNYQNFAIDNDELKKIPDKECCIVCGIIICYNLFFAGFMYGLIQNEDMNGSMN